jgi:predicted DNA binding CopG/RHH family protein
MQQTAATAPSPTPSSFASLLASLAAPASAASDRLQPSSDHELADDGLADDYATLSYERALSTHARYRSSSPSPDAVDLPLPNPVDPEPIRTREAFPIAAPSATSTATPQAASASKADWQQENPQDLPTALDRNLKSASITIRLSQAECAQLRTRAAEAGLTVSAYLRSCTFEAESLRALVKDTMAQLRSDPANGDRASANKPVVNPVFNRRSRRSLRPWWARFWPRAQASHSIAQD